LFFPERAISLIKKPKNKLPKWIGDFGIFKFGRADVEYEEWYGHKLDKKLLELIQKQ
jgi:hypothetical protein